MLEHLRRTTTKCYRLDFLTPHDPHFVLLAGHGGQQEDLDGDEDDGFDETLIPVDFDKNGHIVDDDILKVSSSY